MKLLFLVILASVALCMLRDEEVTEPNPHFIDFVKGFLEGIKETTSPEKIMKCIEEGDHIIKQIVEALKLIKTMVPTKVMEGVKLLIAAITELFHMLKPCTETYEQLKKLIVALTHANIPKIVARILAHPGEFIKHITDIIDAIVKKNHFNAGKYFGELLYQLFLGVILDAEDGFQLFVKGLLVGIKETTDPEKLMNCVQAGEQILNAILIALKLILTMDPAKVLYGVRILFEALITFFYMIKPCIEDYEQLKKLLSAINIFNIPKVVARILAHPLDFISHIKDVLEAMAKQEFFKAGKSFGELLYTLLLALMQ